MLNKKPYLEDIWVGAVNQLLKKESNPSGGNLRITLETRYPNQVAGIIRAPSSTRKSRTKQPGSRFIEVNLGQSSIVSLIQIRRKGAGEKVRNAVS